MRESNERQNGNRLPYLRFVNIFNMEFVWYEAKNKRNLHRHGLDFRDASTVLGGNVITWEDCRFEYGERRFTMIGMLEDVVVVLHTEWQTPTRIISMRRATARERRLYENEVLLRY